LFEEQLYWIVGIFGTLIIFDNFIKIRKDKDKKKIEKNAVKSYIIDLTVDIETKK
jgi:uncharacterized protein with PQ loop repeat